MAKFIVFLIFFLSMFGGRASYLGVVLFAGWSIWKAFVSNPGYFGKFDIMKIALFVSPFFIFLSWCYGVILGVVHDVNIKYVFSNFLGLSLYILFYPYYYYVGAESIKKTIFCVALMACIFGLYHMTVSFASVGGASSIQEHGVSSLRSIYSVSFLYVAPFLFICLANIFLERNSGPDVLSGKLKYLFLIVFGFTLVFPAMSKGFILVFAVMVFLVFLRGYMVALQRCLKVQRNLFFASLAFIILCVLLLLFTDIFEAIFFSFTEAEPSNSVRSAQFEYLTAEWSFSGAGLGSSLQSGYARDEAGYGFELTYINLINKLGVLSIPLFFSYASVLLFGLKLFLLDGKHLVGAWVLGLMAYLLPGAGNPLLLAPVFVFSHFIAIKSILSEKTN